jgi:hypothetical protein
MAVAKAPSPIAAEEVVAGVASQQAIFIPLLA